MEKEALQRKQKLELLRNKRKLQQGNGDSVDTQEIDAPAVTFRNYTPRNTDVNAELRHLNHRRSGVEDDENSAAGDGEGTDESEQESAVDSGNVRVSETRLGPTVESRVKDLAKAVVAEEEAKWKSGEVDILNLAPKKPNWDLKRNLEPKLQKLERQTKNAMAKLIHERLRAEGGGYEPNALKAAEHARKQEEAYDEEEAEGR